MNGTKELDKELAELKGFISDLKADRATQKEKEQRESWTKYTSLSLVFIAVLAAVATQSAGKYSGRTVVELNNATFYQAQASDKWTDYDTKSIKQNLYEALGEFIPKDLAANVSTKGLEAFNARIAKYETEKKKLLDEAQSFEKQRTDARDVAKVASQHGAGMATSISVFQIAIALSSVCLVTKKKPLWYLSMLLAVLAAAKMIQVWLT
jgi:hypothetical protein